MTGDSHPMVTSMREHKGYLYVGGILNNRIGRLKLDGADPDLDRSHLLLGRAVMILDPHPRSLPRQGGHHPADGWRAEAQHLAGRGARFSPRSERPDSLVFDGASLLYASGSHVAAAAVSTQPVKDYGAIITALAHVAQRRCWPWASTQAR